MPRLADHDQRRTQITDAARRVVARDGLGSATFQSVAAEAGISVRLVQYYFGTKRAFLLATHRAVVADAGARFTRSLGVLGADPAPREVIRTVLAELLPTDAARRQDSVVLTMFHTAALTAPAGETTNRTDEDRAASPAADGSGIVADDTLGAPRFLVRIIADQLRRSRTGGSPSGGSPSDVRADGSPSDDRDAGPPTDAPDAGSPSYDQDDADLDAELILAAAAGLAQTLLVDPDAAERADALLDRLLDRMTPA